MSMEETNHAHSVFAEFSRLLDRGVLIFATTITILIALILFQHLRAVEGVRALEHTRSVISYVNALRTYLINLDTVVRHAADSGKLPDLDEYTVCHAPECPQASHLIELAKEDGLDVPSLSQLPILQLALETGMDALEQYKAKRTSTAPIAVDLSNFDKSAIEQIQRILIETERQELSQLQSRESLSNHQQNISSALLAMAGFWMILALAILYRRTILLIRAGVDAEKTIKQLSLHDPLTGLGNRRFLQENGGQLIAAAKRSGKQLAVLAMDLDDFKQVNDTQGHAAGDEVLVACADRMKTLVREADVVARLGGDEFVIVLAQVESVALAREIAGRVVQSLSYPVELQNGEIARIGVSLGIALNHSPEQTLDDLLIQADLALYAAKGDGKGRYYQAGSDVETSFSPG